MKLKPDIDLMQTRMQILNPTPSAVYNGVIQGGYRIATGEGLFSLWRGMSSVVVGAGQFGLNRISTEGY